MTSCARRRPSLACSCPHLQGGYLGFRSRSAGGRYLQARRRAPSLAFHSTLCGVWEQWEAQDVAAAVTPPPRSSVAGDREEVWAHPFSPELCSWTGFVKLTNRQ